MSTECLTDAECEKLLETMTKSGGQDLAANHMKQLKTYCRQSDGNIDRVFRQLFNALVANHSQIRVSAMMIVSELFQRSHRFRLQVIENMNQLFELCLELNPNRNRNYC
ncbi:unnamed protein product [Oppiella nova]|uniref:Uncharacterized protein n=1 Tax=Oppiella nova TaxID=334625 RepID=A0A7R9M2Q1_9ACAR|nr:unnamed protein product [Oppiella nova]CAG2169691.1 unnamed protein product [Oppiella nova]